MSRYIYIVEGSNHTFKTKQEAMEYASFDRWAEYMNGAPQRLTIIARRTPEQHKRYEARLSAIDSQ